MEGILGQIPVKSEDIIFRRIEDEYILVPMHSSSDEVEHIFNLNHVGADIWDRIDGGKTVWEIVQELRQEYDGDAEEIKRDIVEFLEEMHSAGIIRFRDEGD